MEFLPKQPKHIKADPPDYLATDTHQRMKSVIAPEDPSISSIGELLLPYLLGSMQACWIVAILIGLSSSGLFQSSATLIPLLAPFILILGALFLFHYLGMRAPNDTIGKQPGCVKINLSETSIFIIVFTIASLCFIWLNIYAQRVFIFDPKWVLLLFNDILFLNGNFYEAICILGLTFLLGWMGIRLINRNVEPSDVFRALCVGLSVFVVVIILRAGQARQGAVIHDDLSLLLLIPLFLLLSLMAHALARVVFIRKSHPTGLQGSIVAQERAIILMIGVLGLVFLLGALFIGGTTNSLLLANFDHIVAVIGVMYNWLVEIVAAIIVIIVIPIFWLISFLHPSTRLPKVTIFHAPKSVANPSITTMQEAFAHTIIPILSIVLPILFVALMVLLIRWTLRRRSRVRKRVSRRNLDVHESLWSWSLFWLQLRSLMLVLFARFMHRSTTAEDGVVKLEEIKGEPATRSMREIYRALLRKATRYGYPRKGFETPFELKQRIDEKVPLTEPHLELITEAYVFTRYSGEVPDEAQLAQIRENWAELDRKWT
ncbi:MAG: DUF4129 domain-containing protein [Ktedonobacteraceae bacterium]